MSIVLLTFLGRVAKPEGTYRTTRYDFNGKKTVPVAFFGWPLAEHLRPDRVVVLGTSGSMWDHLLERDLDFGSEAEDLRLSLIEVVESKDVRQEHLDKMEPLITERLGRAVRLRLIPYCRTDAEQVELLRILSEQVATRDRVHLDVTHGFRTLPMLGLLAALFLRHVHKAAIDGIWYGAYDPDTNQAPVQNVKGLLHIADWLQALTTYDKDADYGVFAPLLGSAGEQLARAAFFERISNPVKAREALRGWESRADRFPASDPAADLFRQELERRIAWIRRPDRAAWERTLAWRYLESGDYVRAALYGLEAVISAEVAEGNGDIGDFSQREATKEGLKHDKEGFRRLNDLRNALAHGLRPRDDRIEQLLRDQSTLRTTLNELFEKLLGKRER